MKFLLDTHIWLWSLLEPNALSDEVVTILTNEDNDLFISPISIWETLILAEKGRIELYPTPQEWILKALERSPAKEAALTHIIAIKVGKLFYRIKIRQTVSLLQQLGRTT